MYVFRFYAYGLLTDILGVVYVQEKQRGFLPVVVTIFVLIEGYLLIRYGLFSPSRHAVQVVEEFYEYEQIGDYSKSWEFFHTSMKEKFPKGVYVQDRTYVFMGHFGADTFEFKIGNEKELNDWKMSKESKSLETVYEVPVTQYYNGKYGRIEFVQYVYVTEEKGDWVVLWDFNN